MLRWLQSFFILALAGSAGLLMQGGTPRATDTEAPGGWHAAAPRDEIKPRFAFDPAGGPRKQGSLTLLGDARDGLHGWWQKTYPVEGGKYYKFHALRKVQNVAVPRQSVLARIHWRDEKNRAVRADPPPGDTDAKAHLPQATPEYPLDGPEQKWTEVAGLYRAPSKATKAIVELHLRWAPGGRVEWSDVVLTQTSAPKSRKVRLAAVHFIPRGGKTPMDNCRMFEKHVADAARQKADLVVLGETITWMNLNQTFNDVAEPIPGPASDYFCALAKKYRIYIVVGLVERDGHLIYNVSILIGPDGRIIGKYRKVCLPRAEVDAGLSPGREYPVFDTPLGRIGMMICYDGFFPEVARQLSNRGAEIIAWPVAGCNPLLGAARACENHVYLVSSTYNDAKTNWSLTAVYDHAGIPLARAEKWGTVVVAEVDLSQRYFWRNGMGDFRAEYMRARPAR